MSRSAYVYWFNSLGSSARWNSPGPATGDCQLDHRPTRASSRTASRRRASRCLPGQIRSPHSGQRGSVRPRKICPHFRQRVSLALLSPPERSLVRAAKRTTVMMVPGRNHSTIRHQRLSKAGHFRNRSPPAMPSASPRATRAAETLAPRGPTAHKTNRNARPHPGSRLHLPASVWQALVYEHNQPG